jgi:hypothetical protein
MTIFAGGLLLLCFGLGLLLCLLRVLHDLVQDNAQEGPVFQDPGPIFHDHGADCRKVRSQFAWQSRSHFREPD